MKVNKIMSKKLYTASMNETILDVSRLMKKHDIGFVPIVDDDIVYGVVTDRDLILSIADDYDTDTKIKNVMTSSIFKVSETDDLIEALELMGAAQIKRLLVTDNNERLTGVITLSDITKHGNLNEKIDDIVAEIKYNPKTDYSIPNTDLSIDDFPL